MKNKKNLKRLTKKKRRKTIYTQEKASFFRRRTAYLIDLTVIGAISIFVILGLLLILSYINPKEYPNPFDQIKEALRTEKKCYNSL